MRAGIQGENLPDMLEAGAVRDALVSRQDEKWGMAARLHCRAVTGDSLSANCSIPTTSGPSSLIHVP